MEKLLLRMKDLLGELNNASEKEKDEIGKRNINFDKMKKEIQDYYEILSDDTDWEKVKIDTAVLIKNDIHGNWEKAHFNFVEVFSQSRYFFYFPHGKTSFTHTTGESLETGYFCKLFKIKEDE